MSAPAILALALILDAALGEPDWLWRRLPHPTVVMGRAIARAESRLNRGDRRRAKGAAFVTVTAAALAAAGLVPGLLPGGWVLEVIVAAMLLAQRSLADHVAAVAAALDQGLPQARRSVGQIVGRQTAALDRPGVARAAIESAAENLSDGVVAPAFWFLVAGLPGLILYKFVNTADSMIGHLSDRYRAFGWAAARLDDVLNLVPARLTAGLIALAAAHPGALCVALRDARLHRSPNAGWPEAAMAAALGVALGGPRRYAEGLVALPWLNPAGRRLARGADIAAAVGIVWRTWAVGLVVVGVLAAVRPGWP